MPRARDRRAAARKRRARPSAFTAHHATDAQGSDARRRSTPDAPRLCHDAIMTRTTIMADEEVLARLRLIAKESGVSLAEVIREALEARAHRSSSLTFIGSGRSSGRRDTARKSATHRF